MPDHGDDPGSAPLGHHRRFGDRYVDHPGRPPGAHRAEGLAGPPRRYLVIVVMLAGTASLPLVAAISAGPASLGGTALGDTRPFIAPPSEGPVVVPLIPPPAVPPGGQPSAAGELVPMRWPDITALDRQPGWSAGAGGQGGAVPGWGRRVPQPSPSPTPPSAPAPAPSDRPLPDPAPPDQPLPDPAPPDRPAPPPAPDPPAARPPSGITPAAPATGSPAARPARPRPSEVAPARRRTWPLPHAVTTAPADRTRPRRCARRRY